MAHIRGRLTRLERKRRFLHWLVWDRILSSLTEDEHAKVTGCDDAFTQMFGYTAEELIGNSVLDQIHPEDQGRAIEGWLAVLSTRRDQQTRLRRRRKDGSWVWVDTTLHNYLKMTMRGIRHELSKRADTPALAHTLRTSGADRPHQKS